MDSTFTRQLRQTNGGRPSPSATGTKRSRPRQPGRLTFNSTGLNKAVECFGATSAEQMRHVQSLEDILQKFVSKRDVIKTVDTRPFFSSHAINVKGPTRLHRTMRENPYISSKDPRWWTVGLRFFAARSLAAAYLRLPIPLDRGLSGMASKGWQSLVSIR